MAERKSHKAGSGFHEGSTPFEGVPVPERGGATPPSFTATEAKNRFGELLDAARREPVHIQKSGRTVAVILSAEEYQRMIENNAAPKVRPLVEELLEKSIQRRRSLYQALAK